MAMAFSSVMIGLASSLLLTRLIRSLLFGVEATDPITFAGISLLLAMIALLAAHIPGQRTARIDPLISLRSE
jgi:putative ABC transport system permease protein